MAAIRIGISGWTYAPWRGTFFPRALPQSGELAYAARQVASIEINGTFYSLQRPASYARWHDEVPADFVFAVKGPRFITHLKRLDGIAAPLANFFASGVLQLGAKLGPFLWQLPPSFRYDRERLARFFKMLPRDTRAAARLARRHDDKVKQVWLEPAADQPLRHALEVRHQSFLNQEFVDLLREYNVALVVADTAGKWPFMEDVTADFVYVRLHGDSELYVSGYPPAALREWARKIRSWARGTDPTAAKLTDDHAPPAAARDVFVYFDNDVKVRAPYDAMTLAHLLKRGPKPGPPPPVASISGTARRNWPGLGRKKSSAAGRRRSGRTARRAVAVKS